MHGHMSLDAAPQVFPSLFRRLRSQCMKHVNQHQPIVTPYVVHSGILHVHVPPMRVAFPMSNIGLELTPEYMLSYSV